jgi:hypothetical protein
METNKALTSDQLDKLKAAVRQRFDDLYHRIGTSRQKLASTVLLVDQSINKELTKEKIDTVHEKKILNRVREIEREANNQLPHVHKVAAPMTPVVKVKEKPEPKAKPAAKAKPETKAKPKKK